MRVVAQDSTAARTDGSASTLARGAHREVQRELILSRPRPTGASPSTATLVLNLASLALVVVGTVSAETTSHASGHGKTLERRPGPITQLLHTADRAGRDQLHSRFRLIDRTAIESKRNLRKSGSERPVTTPSRPHPSVIQHGARQLANSPDRHVGRTGAGNFAQMLHCEASLLNLP